MCSLYNTVTRSLGVQRLFVLAFVSSRFSLQACDDDCVGASLIDLGTIGDAVLSLNLTGISSAPYGTLSSLENN